MAKPVDTELLAKVLFRLTGFLLATDDTHEISRNVRKLSREVAALGCETCQKHGDDGPPHFGAFFCESGSIASGGTKAHCTCDRCF